MSTNVDAPATEPLPPFRFLHDFVGTLGMFYLNVAQLQEEFARVPDSASMPSIADILEAARQHAEELTLAAIWTATGQPTKA